MAEISQRKGSSGGDGQARPATPPSMQCEPETDACQGMVYQIRLQGHLDGQWQYWFGGLTVTLEDDGVTLLSGTVIDQAALHGLLRKARDLGMALVSVMPVQPDRTKAP